MFSNPELMVASNCLMKFETWLGRTMCVRYTIRQTAAVDLVAFLWEFIADLSFQGLHIRVVNLYHRWAWSRFAFGDGHGRFV